MTKYLILFRPFGVLGPKDLYKIDLLSNILTSSVPDEEFSKIISAALNIKIPTLLLPIRQTLYFST
jgi:hypothetical protein